MMELSIKMNDKSKTMSCSFYLSGVGYIHKKKMIYKAINSNIAAVFVTLLLQ